MFIENQFNKSHFKINSTHIHTRIYSHPLRAAYVFGHGIYKRTYDITDAYPNIRYNKIT